MGPKSILEQGKGTLNGLRLPGKKKKNLGPLRVDVSLDPHPGKHRGEVRSGKECQPTEPFALLINSFKGKKK